VQEPHAPLAPQPRLLWKLSESRPGSPGAKLAALGVSQVMLEHWRDPRLEGQEFHLSVPSGDLRDTEFIRRRMRRIPEIAKLVGSLSPGFGGVRIGTAYSDVCAKCPGARGLCQGPIRLRYVKRTSDGNDHPVHQYFWLIEATCASFDEKGGIGGLRLALVQEGPEAVQPVCR
jgi:hypothetical protein